MADQGVGDGIDSVRSVIDSVQPNVANAGEMLKGVAEILESAANTLGTIVSLARAGSSATADPILLDLLGNVHDELLAPLATLDEKSLTPEDVNRVLLGAIRDSRTLVAQIGFALSTHRQIRAADGVDS